MAPVGRYLPSCTSDFAHGSSVAVNRQAGPSPRVRRFYRVEEGRSPDSGGIGVGLSMAERNVKVDRRKLSMRSETSAPSPLSNRVGRRSRQLSKREPRN